MIQSPPLATQLCTLCCVVVALAFLYVFCPLPKAHIDFKETDRLSRILGTYYGRFMAIRMEKYTHSGEDRDPTWEQKETAAKRNGHYHFIIERGGRRVLIVYALRDSVIVLRILLALFVLRDFFSSFIYSVEDGGGEAQTAVGRTNQSERALAGSAEAMSGEQGGGPDVANVGSRSGDLGLSDDRSTLSPHRQQPHRQSLSSRPSQATPREQAKPASSLHHSFQQQRQHPQGRDRAGGDTEEVASGGRRESSINPYRMLHHTCLNSATTRGPPALTSHSPSTLAVPLHSSASTSGIGSRVRLGSGSETSTALLSTRLGAGAGSSDNSAVAAHPLRGRSVTTGGIVCAQVQALQQHQQQPQAQRQVAGEAAAAASAIAHSAAKPQSAAPAPVPAAAATVASPGSSAQSGRGKGSDGDQDGDGTTTETTTGACARSSASIAAPAAPASNLPTAPTQVASSQQPIAKSSIGTQPIGKVASAAVATTGIATTTQQLSGSLSFNDGKPAGSSGTKREKPWVDAAGGKGGHRRRSSDGSVICGGGQDGDGAGGGGGGDGGQDLKATQEQMKDRKIVTARRLRGTAGTGGSNGNAAPATTALPASRAAAMPAPSAAVPATHSSQDMSTGAGAGLASSYPGQPPPPQQQPTQPVQAHGGLLLLRQGNVGRRLERRLDPRGRRPASATDIKTSSASPVTAPPARLNGGAGAGGPVPLIGPQQQQQLRQQQQQQQQQPHQQQQQQLQKQSAPQQQPHDPQQQQLHDPQQLQLQAQLQHVQQQVQNNAGQLQRRKTPQQQQPPRPPPLRAQQGQGSNPGKMSGGIASQGISVGIGSGGVAGFSFPPPPLAIPGARVAAAGATAACSNSPTLGGFSPTAGSSGRRFSSSMGSGSGGGGGGGGGGGAGSFWASGQAAGLHGAFSGGGGTVGSGGSGGSGMSASSIDRRAQQQQQYQNPTSAGDDNRKCSPSQQQPQMAVSQVEQDMRKAQLVHIYRGPPGLSTDHLDKLAHVALEEFGKQLGMLSRDGNKTVPEVIQAFMRWQPACGGGRDWDGLMRNYKQKLHNERRLLLEKTLEHQASRKKSNLRKHVISCLNECAFDDDANAQASGMSYEHWQSLPQSRSKLVDRSTSISQLGEAALQLGDRCWAVVYPTFEAGGYTCY